MPKFFNGGGMVREKTADEIANSGGIFVGDFYPGLSGGEGRSQFILSRNCFIAPLSYDRKSMVNSLPNPMTNQDGYSPNGQAINPLLGRAKVINDVPENMHLFFIVYFVMIGIGSAISTAIISYAATQHVILQICIFCQS